MLFSTREIQKSDIALIVDYFLEADENFLRNMGADKSKMPQRKNWIQKIAVDLERTYDNKEFYYIIWEVNGQPIGHSNINNIDFGNMATMHLHIWQPEIRQSGFGSQFLRKTIPFYFQNFNLQNLICEPYAHNPAPNRILEKLDFRFVKKYETTPGWINFRQEVNRYELTQIEYEQLAIYKPRKNLSYK